MVNSSNGNVDTAMYYVASELGVYNGLFRAEDLAYLKPFYALCAWGQMRSLGSFHKPCMESCKGLYVSVASNTEEAGILLSNIGTEDVYAELQLDGFQGVNAKFYLMNESEDMALTKTEIFRGDTVIPVVKVGERSVVYISLTKEYRMWTSAYPIRNRMSIVTLFPCETERTRCIKKMLFRRSVVFYR